MDIQTCLARCRFSHHLNFTLGSGVNLKKKKHFCNAESNWTSLLRNCFPGILNRISYIHDLYSGRMDQNGKLAACMLLIIKCCYSCEKYNKDIINSLSAKKENLLCMCPCRFEHLSRHISSVFISNNTAVHMLM